MRTSLAATLAIVLAFSCTDQPTAPTVLTTLEEGAPHFVVGISQQLAALRRATAAFHNFDKAAAAGYDAQITGCDEQLPDGAQGIHYANLALIDGTASLLEPELLQYEPQAGGHLRLVGIEYIVPLTEAQPPPLLGHQFHANEAAGVWALHVWAWRNNPSGLFADWNPKVSCQHAD